MHKWWGSSQDSATQASERDQRAARRTIKNLNLNPLSDDDEFEDCDTSISNTSIFNQLDGPDDTEPEPVMPAAAPVPFDMEDKEDDADAWKKDLKLKFQPHDVEYWINATGVK